ncbi:MAG: hypothetical protein QG599_996 [Pseudomonadota bacterium]|nr:hypothetical protein [Pseudomonadota bacterium]
MPININAVSEIRQHNIQDVLTQGSISLGGKTYSVAVVNDQVSVQRQNLGQMSTGERIANGIKDFFGRLFNEGALTTRAGRLEDRLQGMLQQEVSQSVAQFRSDLQMGQEYLVDHTRDNFVRGQTQDMTDDPEVQQVLLRNLNNPIYSRDRFTGIDEHPTDPTKFIAKFGENQLVLSDRPSTNFEFRGGPLREQLANSDYGNLDQLIGQNHLTSKDSSLVYSANPAIINLAAKMQNYPQAMKDQIIAAISHQPIGNTTVGEAFGDRLRA